MGEQQKMKNKIFYKIFQAWLVLDIHGISGRFFNDLFFLMEILIVYGLKLNIFKFHILALVMVMGAKRMQFRNQ